MIFSSQFFMDGLDDDVHLVEEYVLMDLDGLPADFVRSLAGHQHRVEADGGTIRLEVGGAVFEAPLDPAIPQLDTALVFERGSTDQSGVMVGKKAAAKLKHEMQLQSTPKTAQ